MKNRRGKVHYFLILTICVWLGIYPIYLQYDNLSEIDFLFPTPSFEILDPEDLLAHEDNKEKIFSLRFSFPFSPLNFFLGNPLALPSFQIFPIDQFASILRC